MNVIVSCLNLMLPLIAIRWFKKTKNKLAFLLYVPTLLGIGFDVYNALYGWTTSFWNQVGVSLLIVVSLLVFYLGDFFFVFKTKSLKLVGLLLIVIGVGSYLAVEFVITFRM